GPGRRAPEADLVGQEVLESVLAQPVVEGRTVDAEEPGGHGDVLAGALDGLDDLPALFVGQPLGQRTGLLGRLGPGRTGRRAGAGGHRAARRGTGRRRRGGRCAGPAAEVEIPGLELAALHEDHGPLDDVLELAHVAGPAVAAELLE